ncbi:hypothetical protein CEP53_007074 [Fusarium sp. AF-6]|nr:hypothetical protein CEP53_007074 [Fusarium sp. AF-6]
MDMASASRLILTAMKLVERAGQCHHLQYDEAGWNNLVHTPLLDAVFNNEDPNETQLIHFSPCMTASVSSRFHYFPIPATKVDYVLYLDAGAEDTLWSSRQFGTTMTLAGVFQIIAGLRRLRRWSVEVFWPRYKKHVLHLHEVTQVESGSR